MPEKGGHRLGDLRFCWHAAPPAVEWWFWFWSAAQHGVDLFYVRREPGGFDGKPRFVTRGEGDFMDKDVNTHPDFAGGWWHPVLPAPMPPSV